MSAAPPNTRGDQCQQSIYIALLAPTSQMKVRNRRKYKGNTPTACIVVTDMLPMENWKDCTKVEKLVTDMREQCSAFGAVTACAVPPVHISSWAHQIFVAFDKQEDATKARRHFAKMTTEHGGLIAEVI